MAAFIITLATFCQILISSYATLPENCHGTTNVYCYPVIPSFPHFYGWDMSGVLTFNLWKSTLRWTLKTIPSGTFYQANNIKNLYLNDVGLENLDCQVLRPMKHSLENVQLRYNLFQFFPACAFEDLPKLKTLDLSNQQIKTVIMSNMKLPTLTTISFQKNIISSLILFNLHNQQELEINLDSNKLDTLNISNIRYIKRLSVKENLLKVVDNNLFQFSKTSLKYLDLSENRIDDRIWDALSGIVNLETLILKGNKLSTANHFILNNANKLTKLDLSRNLIGSLADIRLRSHAMTYVSVSANYISSVHFDFISITATYSTGSVNELDLSENLITKITLPIPSDGSNFKIRLDRNLLTEIAFANFNKDIYLLNLTNNRLSGIPDSLPKARYYYISENPLETYNLIQKLQTNMKDATLIEANNVDLFCRDVRPIVPVLNFPNLQTLSLQNNCIPFDFFCYLNMTSQYLQVYLDDNTMSGGTCNAKLNHMKLVSMQNCGIDDSFVSYLEKKNNNTKVNMSLIMNTNRIKKLPFMEVEFSNSLTMDFSKNLIQNVQGFSINIMRHYCYETFTLNLEQNNITHVGRIHFRMDCYRSYSVMDLRYSYNLLSSLNDSVLLVTGRAHIYGQLMVNLDFSWNKINILNHHDILKVDAFGFRYTLQLNVSNNELHMYDECISRDNNFYFSVLDLSHNQLSTLPNASCQMAQEVHFGYNIIKKIFSTIPSANTYKLNLEWNQIGEISDIAFKNLTSLQILNLKGNMLTTFPTAITSAIQLLTLDLSYNKIKSIGVNITGNNLKYLTTLYLAGNDLVVQPVSIIKLNSLTKLDLSENILECDCDLLFLRNSSLQVSGRCSGPSQVVGHHVSCFPVSHCTGQAPLFEIRQTIEKCQNDKYFDIKVSTVQADDDITVSWRLLGPRNPSLQTLTTYTLQKALSKYIFNDSSRQITILIQKPLLFDHACVKALFIENDTYERCINITRENTGNIAVNENTSKTSIYGVAAALSISILMNVCAAVFIWIGRRRKNPKKRVISTKLQSDGNTYEIPETKTKTSNKAVPVYNDLENPNMEEAYVNLALAE